VTTAAAAAADNDNSGTPLSVEDENNDLQYTKSTNLEFINSFAIGLHGQFVRVLGRSEYNSLHKLFSSERQLTILACKIFRV